MQEAGNGAGTSRFARRRRVVERRTTRPMRSGRNRSPSSPRCPRAWSPTANTCRTRRPRSRSTSRRGSKSSQLRGEEAERSAGGSSSAVTGGLAASFLAMNEVFGQRLLQRQRRRDVRVVRLRTQPGLRKNLFVFDDQTHIVRTAHRTARTRCGRSPRARGLPPRAAGFTSQSHSMAAGGNPAGVDELGSAWTPWNPAQLHPRLTARILARQHHGARRVPPRPIHPAASTSRRRPASSIISNANYRALPASRAARATAGQRNLGEACITRSSRAGRPRSAGTTSTGSPVRRAPLAHAQIYPGPGNHPSIRCSAITRSGRSRTCPPDSWKGYNVAPAASSTPTPACLIRAMAPRRRGRSPTRLSNHCAATRQQLRKHPGFFNICIHKGLSPSPDGNVGTITERSSATRTTW